LVSEFALIVIQKFSKMVGQNQAFVEDVSINRPPLFVEENDHFWKVRLQIFLKYVDRGIYDVINGPFVLVIIVNDVHEAKPFA